MNEIKRYDQAIADQLEHLPMPPEDMAWAEMNKMLEEDDDGPVVIPFYRKPGCLIAGLAVALLLLIGGWLYFKNNPAPATVSPQQTADTSGQVYESVGSIVAREGNSTSEKDSSSLVSPSVPIKNGPQNFKDAGMDTSTDINGKKLISAGRQRITVTSPGVEDNPAGQTAKRRNISPGKAGKIKPGIRNRKGLEGWSDGDRQTSAKMVADKKPRSDGDRQTGAKIVADKEPWSDGDRQTSAKVVADKEPRSDGDRQNSAKIVADKEPRSDGLRLTDSTGADSTGVTGSGIVSTDTVTTSAKDTIPLKQEPPASKKEKKEQEKFWQLAAGLAIYQPLPLDGEPTVPYNRYGRKGSFRDYIPALQVRLHRSRKWFANAEFRYGAPQAIKPFDYKEELSDSAQLTSRTLYQLRTTYYHQVPLSFHYYVLPGLSVGAGIIYNRFSGAVARQNIYVGTVTQDTLISSKIMKDPGAGRFIKDHFQWSAALQYQWKRLGIGARYSADINPYISYPALNNSNTTIEKRGKALNVFLRYDLWKSKKWGGK